MLQLNLTSPARLCRGIFPYYQTNTFFWVAPYLSRDYVCHANQLVGMLARKRVNPVQIVQLDATLLYARLVDAPEEYSHIYMSTRHLIPNSSPCPPFDNPELVDFIQVPLNTRVESVR